MELVTNMTPEQQLLIEQIVLTQAIALETDYRFDEVGQDGALTFVNSGYSAIVHFAGPHIQSVSIGDMKAAGSIRAELNVSSLQNAGRRMLLALLREFCYEEPF